MKVNFYAENVDRSCCKTLKEDETEVAPMSIFDFYCKTCEEAGRDQPNNVVMGGATNGKHREQDVICGYCGSVIYSYPESEMGVNNPITPFGDNEEFRRIMNGKDPIIYIKDGEEE